MSDTPGRLLRISEAAELLALKQSTLRKWIVQGKIDVYRPGGRSVRVSEATINSLLRKGHRPAVMV